MIQKKWRINSQYDSSLDVPAQILLNRGIKNTQEFLNPPKTLDLVPTFTPEFKHALLDAKKLVKDCLQEEYLIVIYGDYDADGVCSTSILYKYFTQELGYSKCFYFIPNRFEHGYGLSKKSLEIVLEKTNNEKKVLFITVDTGITAVNEVAYLNGLGYKVLLTDHHQKPDPLPPADQILWNDQIVGSTIAWLLAKVLGSKDSVSISFAALATITDLQPLLGFNRSLVRDGLKVLNENTPLGLKKLLELSGRKESEITTYDIGFVIGPRLNASGRLLDATHSMDLLIETDESKLNDLAQKLNSINSQRQDKTLEMFDIANIVKPGTELPRVLISSSPEYHEGIIGLVASKLTQKYFRPSIVISVSEEFGKGSVRSIPGIDIISILRKFDSLFTNLGGHPMAAGFTIPLINLEALQAGLTTYFNDNFDDSYFDPFVEIDLSLPISVISYDLAEELESLKPFGIGNKEPVFCSKHVKLSSFSKVGKENNHLSFKFMSEGRYFKGIFFGAGDLYNEINLGDNLDITFTLKKSEYNGNKNVDLVLVDLKPSE